MTLIGKRSLILRVTAMLVAFLIISIPYASASQISSAMGDLRHTALTAGNQRYDYQVNDDGTRATLEITNLTSGEIRSDQFQVFEISKKQYIDRSGFGRLMKWFLRWKLSGDRPYYRVVATEGVNVLYDDVATFNPLLAYAPASDAEQGAMPGYAAGNDMSAATAADPLAFQMETREDVRGELQKMIDEVKQSPGYDASNDDEDTAVLLEEYLDDYESYNLAAIQGSSDVPDQGWQQQPVTYYDWHGIAFVKSADKSLVAYPHPDYATYSINDSDLWNHIQGSDGISAIRINHNLAWMMTTVAIVIIVAIVVGIALFLAPGSVLAPILIPTAWAVMGMVSIVNALGLSTAAMATALIAVGALGTAFVIILAVLIVLVIIALIVLGTYFLVRSMTDERGGLWIVHGPKYLWIGGHRIYNFHRIDNP